MILYVVDEEGRVPKDKSLSELASIYMEKADKSDVIALCGEAVDKSLRSLQNKDDAEWDMLFITQNCKVYKFDENQKEKIFTRFKNSDKQIYVIAGEIFDENTGG